MWAASLPKLAPVLALAESMADPGGSTVALLSHRVRPAYAAYAGAALGHSCEFDDCHFECGHPGCCAVPVALALGESLGTGGEAVLRAVVAGYSSAVLAIGPVQPKLLGNGWDGTKVAGVFAAAAAASSLLGLDTAQTADALAIAASDASGTTEFAQSGGDVKALHAGLAARAGIEAAVLAQAGLGGPRTALDGSHGLYRVFAGTSEQPPGSAGDFPIRDVIFRLYPIVARHHAALDALGYLVARHGFGPADVAEIVVGLPPWAAARAGLAGPPKDAVSAQANLGYSVAVKLLTGRNELPLYFDPARWADPDVGALADRVTVVGTDFDVAGAQLGADVEVRLHDGRRFTRFERTFRGNKDNPATSAEIEEKFRRLAADRLPPGRVDRVAEVVSALDVLADVRELTALLRGN